MEELASREKSVYRDHLDSMDVQEKRENEDLMDQEVHQD